MNTTFESNNADHRVATSVISLIVVACFYVIGIILHIKIIKVSKKEKYMTWKLDITHSILIIFLYTYNVAIHTTTYLVHDLYLYTGKWFCYAAKVLSQYLIVYFGAHSMIISMMKYFVIVHDTRILKFKEKFKTGFFYLNFLYPIAFIALSVILIPDFFVIYRGHTHINRCLGIESRNYTTMLSLCDFAAPLQMNSFEGVIFVLRWSICKLQVVFMYLCGFNFFDIVFYCRTFSHMRR